MRIPDQIVEVFRDRTALRRDVGFFIAGLGTSASFLGLEAGYTTMTIAGMGVSAIGASTMYDSRLARKAEESLLNEEAGRLYDRYKEINNNPNEFDL